MATVVDQPARRELAAAVRSLAAGRITNEQFEDRLEMGVSTSRDAGVQAIRQAAWTLYDDTHEHRLGGAYALGRAGRRQVARWILFLKSAEPYQWPEVPRWLGPLLILPNVLTVGLVGLALRWWRDRRGDAKVWPFVRRSDLDLAVAAWPRSAAGGPAVAATGASLRR